MILGENSDSLHVPLSSSALCPVEVAFRRGLSIVWPQRTIKPKARTNACVITNPDPQNWECRVLCTGQPGKSLSLDFLNCRWHSLPHAASTLLSRVSCWASVHVMCAVLRHFSHVQLLAILWTATLWDQAPLSMLFSRQEYWSVLPRPPPRDLPNSGIKPASFFLMYLF